MVSNLLKRLILFSLFIPFLYGDDKIFPVTIRDLSPMTNPDFEIKNNNTLVKGIVKSKLNHSDRSPVYCCGDNHAPSNDAYNFVVHNQTTFHSWFHDVPGVNVPVLSKLVFKQNQTDPRVYYYETPSFFPIDDLGFKDPNYKGKKINEPIYMSKDKFAHNYHFCLEMHASFFYIGGEEFNFKGDDDVWVFINDDLVIDLGAPHTAESASVSLDTLGLTKGKSYNFDFFYCERHTTESYIHISTSIDLECKWKDYCGVCEGTGKCCDVSQCTGSLSPCGSWECPPPNIGTKDWKYNCIMKEPNCTLLDTMCTSYECNAISKTCEPRENVDPCAYTNSCEKKICSEELGGCYEVERKCFSEAFSDPTCYELPCVNGTCTVNRLCDIPDKCVISTCIEGNGCSHLKKQCSDKDYCTIDSCSGITGQCIFDRVKDCQPCNETLCATDENDLCIRRECNPYDNSTCNDIKLVDCDDGNLCTNDICDPKTGKCSNLPVVCEIKDACNKQQCDMLTGKCIVTDNCNDNNICSDDSCSADGECIHTKKNCDDANKCTNDFCKVDIGCVHTNISCKASSVCMVATCDPIKGCVESPIVCPSSAFCLIGQCDVGYGGCNQYDKVCIPDDPHCQYGVCDNSTKECTFKNFDPLPFRCQSAAVKAGVIGGAAIAGVVVGGAVALGLALFGAKAGYNHWMSLKNNQMATSSVNPLYEPSPHQGTNPLWEAPPT
ncbi:hypothetical protein RB653_009317 [Dictyostelium firmibasis]|uniref:PA14 domain-containing protein n=1 Tax=Dictyostelium firmibasis TaxID=79012 RepID=A0AAN7TVA6_9MYCE